MEAIVIFLLIVGILLLFTIRNLQDEKNFWKQEAVGAYKRYTGKNAVMLEDRLLRKYRQGEFKREWKY